MQSRDEGEAIQSAESMMGENHRVPPEPTCSLCGGRLSLEQNVRTSFEGYFLAWVCTQCSAAFPIAVGKRGFLGRNPQPLYAWGERIKPK